MRSPKMVMSHYARSSPTQELDLYLAWHQTPVDSHSLARHPLVTIRSHWRSRPVRPSLDPQDSRHRGRTLPSQAKEAFVHQSSPLGVYNGGTCRLILSRVGAMGIAIATP